MAMNPKYLNLEYITEEQCIFFMENLLFYRTSSNTLNVNVLRM